MFYFPSTKNKTWKKNRFLRPIKFPKTGLAEHVAQFSHLHFSTLMRANGRVDGRVNGRVNGRSLLPFAISHFPYYMCIYWRDQARNWLGPAPPCLQNASHGRSYFLSTFSMGFWYPFIFSNSVQTRAKRLNGKIPFNSLKNSFQVIKFVEKIAAFLCSSAADLFPCSMHNGGPIPEIA